MPDQTSREILTLLTEERATIRSADFDQLDKLAERKKALFAALETSQPSKAELAEIKMRLDTNQTLLSAAMKGVAEAQERLSAVRNVREGLSTYDQSGQISRVQTGRPGVEKKA